MGNNTPKEQLIKMAYKAGAVVKAQKARRIEEYNKSPNVCTLCGKPLDYEHRKNKFCNQSCAATYNNAKRSNTQCFADTLKNKTCKNCGGPIKRRRKESYAKAMLKEFCCNKCRLDYQQKDFIIKWKAGKITGTSSENDIHERVRQYMLEKANYSCELCGWHEINPATGKVPVQVHHKDGDCTNNREDNLQVLCPNCHSLTSTYGAINKGSGRFNRLKYKTKEYLMDKVDKDL